MPPRFVPGESFYELTGIVSPQLHGYNSPSCLLFIVVIRELHTRSTLFTDLSGPLVRSKRGVVLGSPGLSILQNYNLGPEVEFVSNTELLGSRF